MSERAKSPEWGRGGGGWGGVGAEGVKANNFK